MLQAWGCRCQQIFAGAVHCNASTGHTFLAVNSWRPKLWWFWPVWPACKRKMVAESLTSRRKSPLQVPSAAYSIRPRWPCHRFQCTSKLLLVHLCCRCGLSADLNGKILIAILLSLRLCHELNAPQGQVWEVVTCVLQNKCCRLYPTIKGFACWCSAVRLLTDTKKEKESLQLSAIITGAF